jgi:hypothetical protein
VPPSFAEGVRDLQEGAMTCARQVTRSLETDAKRGGFVSSHPPEDPQRNWFTTLPGILTSAGGFVAALTGLLVALNQVGVLPVKTSPAVSASSAPGGARTAGEETSYVIWHMAMAGGAWLLDDVEYPPVDPCAGGAARSKDAGGAAMLNSVRDYYGAWNDRRLDDAWALLSAQYQQKTRGAWRAYHSIDRSVRLSSDCVLPGSLIGMTVVSSAR